MPKIWSWGCPKFPGRYAKPLIDCMLFLILLLFLCGGLGLLFKFICKIKAWRIWRIGLSRLVAWPFSSTVPCSEWSQSSWLVAVSRARLWGYFFISTRACNLVLGSCIRSPTDCSSQSLGLCSCCVGQYSLVVFWYRFLGYNYPGWCCWFRLGGAGISYGLRYTCL